MKIYNFTQIISSHPSRYTDGLTRQIKIYEVMPCSLQINLNGGSTHIDRRAYLCW
jgi:hypothetical protein